MNPTTHPHMFRRLELTEILQPGDIRKSMGEWSPTLQAGDPVSAGSSTLYYRKIEPTTKNKPMKPIAIDTHSKPSLAKAVLAVLEPHLKSSHNFKSIAASPSRWLQVSYATFRGSPEIYHGPSLCSTGEWRGQTVIDAATEFGKLVELLEAPPEVKIKLQNHEAVVKGDKSGVQIGCKFASKETVRKVREAINQGASKPGTFVVRVGRSELMSKTIQALLLESGRVWMGGDKAVTSIPYVTSHQEGGAIKVNDNGRMEYANAKYYDSYGHKTLDASTEMGKLIELLEGTREKTIKVLLQDSNGQNTNREATITDKGVTIMGETITKEQVEEIWKALQ